ncbi:hypothetical protein GF359_07615 [candidate division WOR-3 bacterium]|uniref:Uncharacterized protein n=1 Tax=candidate division WOR-3 bacterium TaxID=2052148 RepID=A0A9D5QCV2_UNCW3|nr:hypothetical protein [candidate division WOR-3 bacterium]MBD3365068.1 hypothetical protein [candidate division WOR-3 bacterium]
MKFIRWVTNIDRRIIFLLMFVVVLVPILIDIPLETDVGPTVEAAYTAVDTLPPGSVIMLSVDYDATSYPECHPMIVAVSNHAFSKGLRIILVAHIPTGLPLGQAAVEEAAFEYNKLHKQEYDAAIKQAITTYPDTSSVEFRQVREDAAVKYKKRYGVDYVNLGFRPGLASIMVGMGREIRDFYAQDYKSTDVDSLPMMKRVHNYEDIALLASFAHGKQVEYWIQYAGARYGQKIIAGVTGVVIPDLYPFLQSKQLSGLIGGLKGANEYEFLLGRKGLGTKGMPAQSTAHILVIFLIVLGTIFEFILSILSRRKS